MSKSLVVLSISGILNGPGNIDEISRLPRHLPRTIQSLNNSGTVLTKTHVLDPQKVCRQVYVIKLGNPMEIYGYSWRVPITCTDELQMTDLEEIIIGPSDKRIKSTTVCEFDISTTDFIEQEKLKRSKLMSNLSSKLKTVTVNNSVFGLEITTWTSRAGGWNVTEGWLAKLLIERLPDHPRVSSRII